MAYDQERTRIYTELNAVLGMTRTIDGLLEREAAERAEEARNQVGLGPPYPVIQHETPEERRARLSLPLGFLVPEIATWNLQFNDPVRAAINGWLNSAPHRAVLDSDTYKYWGVGIYTELPTNEPEINRRWYFVMWLSNLAIPAPPLETALNLFARMKGVGTQEIIVPTGTILRKGPGEQYPLHWEVPSPTKFRVAGTIDNWIVAHRPNGTGVFFAPPTED